MVSPNSSKPEYFMCSSFRSTATQEYQKNGKKGGGKMIAPLISVTWGEGL